MFFGLLEWNIFVLIFGIILMALYESRFLPRDFYTAESVKSYIIFVVMYFISLIVFYGLKFGNTIFNNSIEFFNDGYFYNNWIIVIIKFFLIAVVCICLVLSYDFLKNRDDYVEYIIMVLFSLVAMFFLMSACDFFVAFLVIEFQTFCFYVVFVIVKYRNVVIEAAIKYYMLSLLASGLFALGISFIYGSCGTTKFIELSVLFPMHLSFGNNVLDMYSLGIFLFLTGIFFKLAVVPFHYWIADIYEGLPLSVVFLYSTTSKISYIVFLINLMNLLLLNVMFLNLLFFLALFSIIFGSVAALYQTDLMRMLGFGAINHVGFILMGVSFATKETMIISLNYLFVYIFLLVGFFCVMLVFKAVGICDESLNVKSITKLYDMSNSGYVVSIIFSTFILSFAGVPPFAGFFAKLGVLLILAKSGSYLYLLVIGIISVLSAVYYIRLLRFLFFSKESNKIINNFKFEFSYFLFFIILLCLFFNLFFFYFQFYVFLV